MKIVILWLNSLIEYNKEGWFWRRAYTPGVFFYRRRPSKTKIFSLYHLRYKSFANRDFWVCGVFESFWLSTSSMGLFWNHLRVMPSFTYSSRFFFLNIIDFYRPFSVGVLSGFVDYRLMVLFGNLIEIQLFKQKYFTLFSESDLPIFCRVRLLLVFSVFS